MRLSFVCAFFVLYAAHVKAAEPCNPDVCKLPDCFCSGNNIPKNLSASSTPQIVLLTFNSAVNSLTYSYAQEILTAGITNPNGCDITGTFFVSHEYTDYRDVMVVRNERNEIAVNTVSASRYPPSWWATATLDQWKAEIADMKEILRVWGQVEADSIVGFRAPEIQVGGNAEFGALHELDFLYESSMPTQNSLDHPFWPYTLDYSSTQDCEIPPCPTDSLPGLWEVPIVDYEDNSPTRFCNFLDSCQPPPENVEDVVNFLYTNFERHYNSNRAPFFISTDPAWFALHPGYSEQGVITFLKGVAARGDVWIVTISQAIEWIKNPTTLDKIKDFKPWQCDSAPPPPPCSPQAVSTCTYDNGTHVMMTCTSPCPPHYPWTGNPHGL